MILLDILIMFIHLHVHSHYSLLDGLAKIDALIAKAKEFKMNALAITDHGVMYGAIEFYQKCREAGIKPIIGEEVYIARNGRLQKRAKIDEKPYHLILLAKNLEGYQNLIKLTSIAHLEGFYYKPRIDWDVLEKYSSGLIAMTACIQGEIPQLVLDGKTEKVKETINKYQNIFGKDNFYLEVMDHPNSKEQNQINEALFDFGKKLNIPVVATNDVHYLNSEDDEAQDILLCLQTKKEKKEKDRLSMLGEDLSFKSPQVMADVFKDYPESIENTQKIAERCNLEIELEKTKLPYFELPGGKTADEYLKELSKNAIQKRYGASTKQIEERLERELEIIKKTGFASYFLIVQDFVNWAKNRQIIVGPCRGSVGGSLVSYLLNITDIDPLKYDLLFERFLTDSRVSPPDIDLDFADTRRNEVIEYVENKYGEDRVCQIITFGTMAARAAVRDVARVLSYPYNFGDKIAKLIPSFSNLNEAVKIVPELSDLYQNNSDVKIIIEMAKKLEGVVRHASTHACGVVIAREPLDHYLPLQYASSSDRTIISQYGMTSVEAIGLLKMDFLGLKNLTLIEQAIKIIANTKKKEIDFKKIPFDDEKTFSLLRQAKSTGVFQLESSGMKRYLKQLKPTEFEDIIAMVALFRPGPMELIPQYISTKHGFSQPSYLHPKLKPILEKTHGIMIYQEQLMQIAQQLAGFTLLEADVLRKAVGKKIKNLLLKQEEKLIGGMIKNGIKKEIAKKIWEWILPFASYGFNKSHATGYATIAYQTAYLKAHYPEEFMAALLTSDQNDIERIAIEVEECKQMGIKVLPPDINESFENFTVVRQEDKTAKPLIRFGLRAIKNIGSGIVGAIIKERKENGFYQNLEDFLKRVQSKDLNKKSLESLIKSGALDKFGERNQLLENIDKLLNFAKETNKEKQSGQTNIFSFSHFSQKIYALKLQGAVMATTKQKLDWEKEFIGLYISDHPLNEFNPHLAKFITPCNRLFESFNKGIRDVKILGVVTKVKKIFTNANELMLFAKLEDNSGNVEAVVFPSILKNNAVAWQEDKIILIRGKLSNKDGEIKILSDKAMEMTRENLAKILNNNTHNNIANSPKIG